MPPKACIPANDDDEEERRCNIARTGASTDNDENNHEAGNQPPAVDEDAKPAAAENPSNPAPKCHNEVEEDESRSCQVSHPEHLLVEVKCRWACRDDLAL